MRFIVSSRINTRRQGELEFAYRPIVTSEGTTTRDSQAFAMGLMVESLRVVGAGDVGAIPRMMEAEG